MSQIEIELEDDVAESCKRRIQRTEFASIEDYIAFIVSKVVSDEGNEMGDRDDVSKQDDQLQALGYLD